MGGCMGGSTLHGPALTRTYAPLRTLQDILTDLRLTPASLDPEGLAEGPWRRPPQLQGAEKGARGGTPPVALTAALVRSVAAVGATVLAG